MPEESKPQSWWQTIPGILTGIGALLSAVTGLIVALRHDDQSKVVPDIPAMTQQASPVRQSSSRPPTRSELPDVIPAQLTISGVWRDNWGIVSQLVQDGNAFQFSTEGTSCKGGYFQSSGTGRIIGNSIQSSYQSNLPSQGSCSGILSPDGVQITSTCTDSVCGTFVATSVRQNQ